MCRLLSTKKPPPKERRIWHNGSQERPPEHRGELLGVQPPKGGDCVRWVFILLIAEIRKLVSALAELIRAIAELVRSLKAHF
jgi:hypothetical protein